MGFLRRRREKKEMKTKKEIEEKLEILTRAELKEGLSRLTDKNHILFKRMYSHENLDLPINTIVDNMNANKLDWAIQQVHRTLVK